MGVWTRDIINTPDEDHNIITWSPSAVKKLRCLLQHHGISLFVEDIPKVCFGAISLQMYILDVLPMWSVYRR